MPTPSVIPDVVGALPNIDLYHVLRSATETHGARALWQGSGVLAVGMVFRVLAEKKRSLEGGEARYLQVFLEAAAFAALMAAYQPLVAATIRIIQELGTPVDGTSTFDLAFARRAAAYHEWDVLHDRTGALGFLTPDGLISSLLRFTMMILNVGVQAVAFVLRCLQTFALSLVILYGPLLLGVAFCGRFFLPLGVGWFWTLIELSAWSVTMDMLLFGFGKFAADIPKDFNTVHELVISATMVVLLVSVPVLTAILIRGQAAGQLGYSAMAGLYGLGKMALPAGRSSKLVGAARSAAATARSAARTTVSAGHGLASAGAWMAGKSREAFTRAPTVQPPSAGKAPQGLAQEAVAQYMAQSKAKPGPAYAAPPETSPIGGRPPKASGPAAPGAHSPKGVA